MPPLPPVELPLPQGIYMLHIFSVLCTVHLGRIKVHTHKFMTHLITVNNMDTYTSPACAVPVCMCILTGILGLT